MACLRIFFALIIILYPARASAQIPGGEMPPAGLPPLTGPQRQTLLLIAREAVDAAFENRPSREAFVEERLRVPQPLVVSIYVDGRLRARAWRLKPHQPLYLDARDVTYEALSRPRDQADPLRPDELARAEVGLAVLSGYTKVLDERDVPPRTAVIVLSGFTEALALPDDVESGQAADLLSFACERAGLRPHIWLLPEAATIFFASVDGIRERPRLPAGR